MLAKNFIKTKTDDWKKDDLRYSEESLKTDIFNNEKNPEKIKYIKSPRKELKIFKGRGRRDKR